MPFDLFNCKLVLPQEYLIKPSGFIFEWAIQRIINTILGLWEKWI